MTKEEFVEKNSSRYTEDDMLEAAWEIAGGDPDHAASIAQEYCGEWDSDVEFARETVESCHDLGGKDGQWTPMYYIDWEWLAKDLMMDYSEHDGHYFRQV